MKLFLAALAVSAALWAADSLAQAPAPAAVPPPVPPAAASPATPAVPASRWTAAQAREAFQLADADSDGRLTRAEAQRLPIMPRSFEETDLNKDGVLTLPEYQASFAAP